MSPLSVLWKIILKKYHKHTKLKEKDIFIYYIDIFLVEALPSGAQS